MCVLPNGDASLKLNCLSSSYCNCELNWCQLSRIMPIHSQVLTVFHGQIPVNITLDSGATTSFILAELCRKLDLKIQPNGQLAKLGDGCTVMASVGEVDVNFTRDKWTVRFRAIVVESLNSDIYGGMTFHWDNDIQPKIKTGQIVVHGKHTIYQTNMLMPPPQINSITYQSSTVTPAKSVVFPPAQPLWPNTTEAAEDHKEASTLDVVLPPDYDQEKFVIVEPREENYNQDWPPVQICAVEEGMIKIENSTDKVISIPKDIHILGIIPTTLKQTCDIISESKSVQLSSIPNLENQTTGSLENKAIENASKIDVSRAPEQLQQKLISAHLQFANVFAPDLTTGYNGFSGKHLVKLQFADENRPHMTKRHVPKWSGKNDGVKQRKMDSLENQGVLVDPYKHNIPIKLISPCFLKVKARAKDKDLEECDLSEIRWIISPGQLNPHLRQLHTTSVTKEDLFIFKSEKPYCIEFDLYDGYFQNHVHKDDWGFLAVETPYKGLRVLTRSGQGLLNQEIEMNQLLSKVLGEEIEKKNVIIQADDGQVGGSTEEDTINNWIKVLQILSRNNIKINYKKVKILPDKSLIHGWEFRDGHVEPDPHRKLAILDMKIPKTIGEMRTYMGVFKTFFPAMRRLTNLMDPFDKLCGGRDSKESIDWNDDLRDKFKESQDVAQVDINKLALPHPDEQLFIVPDAASRPPAIGFILFVDRKPAEPVMFANWKLADHHLNWTTCELEGYGASVAAEKCSFYILRSKKPTLIFPDNKQVIQAFNKLRKGRYSTSQRLATFTNNIQKYPIEMQHGSGKLLQNIGADYISRNAEDCNDENCVVCKFVEESDNILSSSTGSINNLLLPEIDFSSISKAWKDANIARFQDIPIGNLSGWTKLQDDDDAINKAIKYKRTGQNPPKSDRTEKMKEIRSYVTSCKISPNSKLLVKEEPIPFDHKKREKIVVPSWFLKPLLVQIHLEQKCPEQSQLKKIFDRYFHGYQMGNMFKIIQDSCRMCQARKKIPKEMKHFQSITNPSSPGENFVSDVLKRANQLIFVTRDSFSDFVTTTIIKTEKSEDLKEGIIATTNYVRKNSTISVRVDNAPGFQSLKKTNDGDLQTLKISLELSNPENKNGLAIVDKAIQELEKELVRISPEGKSISSTELAQATLALNSRIRNRNFSSHEIMFSREQNTGENILLDDKKMGEVKEKLKNENHKYSEKSKFPDHNEPTSARAKKGDYVHLKDDGGKHTSREQYLVTDSDEKTVKLLKLLHSFNEKLQTKFGSKHIVVKQTDIYIADSHDKMKVTHDKTAEQEPPDRPDKPKPENPKPSVWCPFTNEKSNEKRKWSPFAPKNDDSESSDDEQQALATNVEESNSSDESDNQLAERSETNGNESEETSEPESSIPGTDELHDPQIQNPPVFPRIGHRIAFLDRKLKPPSIVHATVLPMFKTVQRKWPGWYNIQCDDHPTQSSVNLRVVRWKFIFPQQNPTEDESDTSNISTAPADNPEISEEEAESIDKQSQDNSADFDEQQEENTDTENDDQIGDNLNEAFEDETPLFGHTSTPFPEVLNLETVLPLTSTPTSPLFQASGAHKKRLSDVRPRGFLPVELQESPLGSVNRPGPSRIQRAASNKAESIQKLISTANDDSTNSD